MARIENKTYHAIYEAIRKLAHFIRGGSMVTLIVPFVVSMMTTGFVVLAIADPIPFAATPITRTSMAVTKNSKVPVPFARRFNMPTRKELFTGT